MSDTPRTQAKYAEIFAEDDHEAVEKMNEFAQQIERELNAANERIKRLEEWIKDLDTIGSHSGKNDMREWNGDIGWLYPGQVAYIGESKP